MLRHLVLLASVPLVLCAALGSLGARAQTSAGDTPSDDAPATVQNNATVDPADDGAHGSAVTPTVPATVGGAATTRAPGGVLGGAVGTGTLAPSTSRGINAAGTNEAMGTGQATTGGPSSFGNLPPGGFLVPGTYTPGVNGAAGTWVPGLGMAPGTVVGPGLAGAAQGPQGQQAPVAIPSGVAVGSDGQPFNAQRPRNVGEGEGESPASANASGNVSGNVSGNASGNASGNVSGNVSGNAGATTSSPAPGVAMPAAVYIVAPGFVPAGGATGAATDRARRDIAGRSADDDDDNNDADDERDVTPIDVTSSDLAQAPESYGDRKLTLRGRVTAVNGNSFTVSSSTKNAATTTVIAPTPLSDSPLREDVIVTGVLDNRDGQRVLVAESVIQIER